MDKRQFRDIAGKFATGVTVVTVKYKGDIHGMTVNGFASVSLEPSLILISIGKQQKIHDILLSSGRFGVSILQEDQRMISDHFGGKFDETLMVPFIENKGMPLVREALGYFIAKVVNTHEEGDHTLFIGEVEVCEMGDAQKKPLLFFNGKYNFL